MQGSLGQSAVQVCTLDVWAENTLQEETKCRCSQFTYIRPQRGETHLGNGGTIHKINGAGRAEAGQHWADDR